MAVVRPRMTEDEFLRMPDDGRKYELVDGEAIEVPGGVKHDVIGAHIIALLYPFTRRRGYLAGSQAGFRMTTRNIRAPDISFTLKDRFPDGQPPEGFGDLAPDLCIEIISPSEDQDEMDRKLREYFDSGAQRVWRLYPAPRQAVVFHSPADSVTLAADDEIDGDSLLPGFRCRVAELFEIE